MVPYNNSIYKTIYEFLIIIIWIEVPYNDSIHRTIYLLPTMIIWAGVTLNGRDCKTTYELRTSIICMGVSNTVVNKIWLPKTTHVLLMIIYERSLCFYDRVVSPR